MAENVKHTPTPWKYIFNGTYGEFHSLNGYFIGDTCPQMPMKINKELSYANAEHIVRCVNSHDDLVAALEVALKLCGKCDADTCDDTTYITIKDALAKAKGDPV